MVPPRVCRYTGDGGLATNATLHNPVGLSFNVAGDLFIVDTDNGVVRRCVVGAHTKLLVSLRRTLTNSKPLA